MSILIFLGVLFALVLVHELGHFVVAKFTGMRVDEFGIGFPPKLFGIKRGETTYSINTFPIGGFVKIYGEDGEGDPSARLAEDLSEQREGESPASGQRRYGEDGTEDQTGERTQSSDGEAVQTVTVNSGAREGRSFTSKSKIAQSAVLLAGVSMNIIFAWLLVTIAFSIGVKSSVDEATAGPHASLTITSVLAGSPANNAKLPVGAIIKDASANGEKLTALTPSVFSSFIASHANTSITIAYTENGEVHVTQITPQTNIIEGNSERGAIGVALTQIDTVKRSLPDAMIASFMYTVTGLRDITIGIWNLLYDTVLMRADFSQVAGPIGIVGLVGEASAFGITSLLMFTAFISLNLAVINVLPFPALDGGRFLFVIIESIKGSPITPRFVGVVNTVGFFILITLMVAVTWSDISKLL